MGILFENRGRACIDLRLLLQFVYHQAALINICYKIGGNKL